jgi:hypothetical protein
MNRVPAWIGPTRPGESHRAVRAVDERAEGCEGVSGVVIVVCGSRTGRSRGPKLLFRLYALTRAWRHSSTAAQSCHMSSREEDDGDDEEPAGRVFSIQSNLNGDG